MEQIKSPEQWVLHRLSKFYENTENIQKLEDILTGKSIISLRIIDWFVTNYSKKYNCSFMNSKNKHIVIYLSYKSHLKAYSKRMFDPFCRSKRIQFKNLETTVGQLNFFEWIISDEILNFLQENRDVVHQDMEKRIQESKESLKSKRSELSISATNTIVKHDFPVKITFD
jgi:hypothetical protein